jgi:hypothetical protein
VRIKFGIKAWSTLSAMLLSLVMISGCNEEPSGTGAAPGGVGKAPDKAPPVTPPKDDAKKAP